MHVHVTYIDQLISCAFAALNVYTVFGFASLWPWSERAADKTIIQWDAHYAEV